MIDFGYVITMAKKITETIVCDSCGIILTTIRYNEGTEISKALKQLAYPTYTFSIEQDLCIDCVIERLELRIDELEEEKARIG